MPPAGSAQMIGLTRNFRIGDENEAAGAADAAA
jgi:hypothetical protein